MQTTTHIDPVIAKRDAKRVARFATCLIKLSPEGEISVSWNKQLGLNILAVVGPAEHEGERYEQVLLCEIGLARAWPYHRLASHVRHICVKQRRKWFSMTEAQYRFVAPTIFQCLQGWVDWRVAQWQHGVFYINSERHWFVRQNNGYGPRGVRVPIRRGVYLTIDRRDKLLFRDVYFAELYANQTLRGQISGLARVIDHALKPYRFGTKREVTSLAGFAATRSMLSTSRLPRYLKAELGGYLAAKASSQYWPEIAQVIGLDLSSLPLAPQREARAALSGAKVRVAGMELRVRRSARGCLSVEIFPRAQLRDLLPRNGNRPVSQSVVSDADESRLHTNGHSVDRNGSTDDVPF